MERSRGAKKSKKARKKHKSQNTSPDLSKGRLSDFSLQETSSNALDSTYPAAKYTIPSRNETSNSFIPTSPNFKKQASFHKDTYLQETSPNSRKASPFKSQYASAVFPSQESPLASYYKNIRNTDYPLFSQKQKCAENLQYTRNVQCTPNQPTEGSEFLQIFQCCPSPNSLSKSGVVSSPSGLCFCECPSQQQLFQLEGGCCYRSQEVSMPKKQRKSDDKAPVNVVCCCRRPENKAVCPHKTPCCQMNEDCQYFLVQSSSPRCITMVDKSVQYEESEVDMEWQEEGGGCPCGKPMIKKSSVHYAPGVFGQGQIDQRLGTGYPEVVPASSYVPVTSSGHKFSKSKGTFSKPILTQGRSRQQNCGDNQTYDQRMQSCCESCEDALGMPSIIFETPELPCQPTSQPHVSSPPLSGQVDSESETQKSKKTRVCRTTEEGDYTCDWEDRPEHETQALAADDTVWVIKTSSDGETEKFFVTLNKQRVDKDAGPQINRKATNATNVESTISFQEEQSKSKKSLAYNAESKKSMNAESKKSIRSTKYSTTE